MRSAISGASSLTPNRDVSSPAEARSFETRVIESMRPATFAPRWPPPVVSTMPMRVSGRSRQPVEPLTSSRPSSVGSSSTASTASQPIGLTSISPLASASMASAGVVVVLIVASSGSLLGNVRGSDG